MLRLVHEDLDNSQPGCRHMRLIQVALRIKFVPSVTDEGRMPSCKAEVSDLPSWTIASSQSSVEAVIATKFVAISVLQGSVITTRFIIIIVIIINELPLPWNNAPPVFH